MVAVSPSYFAPTAYRIFKEVDPDHDWWPSSTAAYDTLFAASSAPLGAGARPGAAGLGGLGRPPASRCPSPAEEGTPPATASTRPHVLAGGPRPRRDPSDG